MEDERARALALLEAVHKFPTEYHVSVITMNVDEVFVELRAAVEEGLVSPLAEDAHEIVPSRGGKYSSHRFRVPVESAEAVLALYARIRAVRGVMTVL
jgi:putative lipoic acid-binding regulatory protein